MDLYTHPGKMGDALWAFATARAHSGGKRFDFATSAYCTPLIPLLQAQECVAHAYVLENWNIRFDAPVTPPVPPWSSGAYTNAYHLGMREWPSPTCVEYYPRLLLQEYGQRVEINFNLPWLDSSMVAPSSHIALSFSDEWIELKVGWILALCTAFPEERFWLCSHPESRLNREFRLVLPNLVKEVSGVYGLAARLDMCKFAIVCNSLAHPLGSALGTELIIAEPSMPRQQPVFKAPIARNHYFDGINSYELVDIVKQLLR